MRRPLSLVSTAVAVAALAAVSLGAPVATAAPPSGSQPDRIVLNPTPTPETSQTITWRTAVSVTEGRVQVRTRGGTEISEVPASATASSSVAGTGSHHHTATLTALVPDTSYDYRVGGDAGWSAWHTFTTAHTGDRPWSFLYFGDAQNGLTDRWPPVVQRALAAEPDADLALHAGDMINNADADDEWGHWFDALAPSLATTNQVLTPGNHEMSGDPLLSQYKAHFDFPRNGTLLGDETVWYADYQGVRFISLNGNSLLPVDQAAWLDGVLRSNPNKWTVVTFHQPLFSGSEGRDNPHLRLAWLSILEEHGVDLVLQGHDHTYARGHLANREREGGHDGPVYTVTVAGSKYYDLSPAEANNWTRNGAVRAAGHGQTSTYQVIRVDGDTMTYESVIGAKGESSTALGEVGDTLDSFTITKDDQGAKVVTNGVSDPGQPSPDHPAAPGMPDAPGSVTKRAAAKVKVQKVRRVGERRGRVKVRVRSAGQVTGGRVIVRLGGRKIGMATVSRKGIAKVRLRKLPERAAQLRVRYRGTETTAPARTTARLPRR